MDFALWNQILLELTLSFSSEPQLNKLVKKACAAFLKKLDCTHVSILQHKNGRLKTVHAMPRIVLKNPAYHNLAGEMGQKLRAHHSGVLVMEKELYYYGFPLKHFGLLLLGRSTPLGGMILNELLPITDMLAQNCFAAFDAAMKRRAIKAELEKERRKAFEKVRTEKRWLKVLFENSSDAIVRIDADFRVREINRSFQRLFRYDKTDLRGKNITRVFDRETPEASTGHIKDLISGRRAVLEETRYTKEGAPVRVQIKCVPIVINSALLGAYVIYNDVTEQRHYEEHLEFLSMHDPLTGLHNRRYVEREIKRLGSAHDDLPIAAIVGDVNGLKLVNNVFGHQAGDRLLVKGAKAMQESCRREDIVARYGGDEFLILLPRTPEAAAEKIIRRINALCSAKGVHDMQLSISLGHAVKTKPEENLQQTIREAEESMYRRKLLDGKSHRNIIMKTMMSTLYEKSRETEKHSARLRRYCLPVGRKLGLTSKELDDLALLALLHDIGKVNISQSILKKPGPLTPEEFEEIKKHPEIGYRIVQNAPELAAVAQYILAHHERWDGKGYPRGLKGEEIPLPSRILAVADAFDAMTYGRIYRNPLSIENAVTELRANAGTQFDPAVTELFITQIQQNGNLVPAPETAATPGLG